MYNLVGGSYGLVEGWSCSLVPYSTDITTSDLMADFKTWFTNAGGSLNQSVGITEFPGMGQGAIAINAIPVSTLKTVVLLRF